MTAYQLLAENGLTSARHNSFFANCQLKPSPIALKSVGLFYCLKFSLSDTFRVSSTSRKGMRAVRLETNRPLGKITYTPCLRSIASVWQVEASMQSLRKNPPKIWLHGTAVPLVISSAVGEFG